MPLWKNKLYFGDNLRIMREYIPDSSVDLIYLDPPFNSKATYNVLFKEKNGSESAAQIAAFDDTWRWDAAAAEIYHELVTRGPKKLADLMLAFHAFLGLNDMMAYLSMMAVRLVEMRRALKDTGSIYLHCDPTASHYLKLVMDAAFGGENFQNEIVWKRTTSHNDPQRYGRIADRILFYSKSEKKSFNRVFTGYSTEQLSRYKHENDYGVYRAENLTAPHFSATRTIEWKGVHPGDNRQWRFSIEELERLYDDGRILLRKDGKPRKDGLKVYLAETEGAPLQDVWSDIVMSPTTSERLGYPTQKPEALLERILKASSNEGDVVLDPFCGCGTSVNVAERLHRKWIGVDITHLAITLIKHRLADTFGQELAPYEIVGDPKDMASARSLAAQDRHQFEWWVLSLVDARPAQDKRKGADRGVDGCIYFFDDESGQAKKIVVQVKSVHVNAAQIRDLKGTIEREKAVIGVFITLEESTAPMRSEAADAGFYEFHHIISGRDLKFPRMQIYTIEELLNGALVKMPAHALEATMRKAERKKKEKSEEQMPLL